MLSFLQLEFIEWFVEFWPIGAAFGWAAGIVAGAVIYRDAKERGIKHAHVLGLGAFLAGILTTVIGTIVYFILYMVIRQMLIYKGVIAKETTAEG